MVITKLALELNSKLLIMSIYLIYLFTKIANVCYQLRYKILLEIFKWFSFTVSFEMTAFFVMSSFLTLCLTVSPGSAQCFPSLLIYMDITRQFY